MFSQVIINKY